MNTRKHIVAALMLVVAVAAAVLVGCKKENNSAQNDCNEIVVSKEDDMSAYLRQFKKKMQSAAKGDETLSMEDARWHLEAVLNYTYGDAGYQISDVQCDTMYFEIQTDGQEMTLSQLNEAFVSLSADVESAFANCTLPEKSILSIQTTFDDNCKDNFVRVQTVLSTRGLTNVKTRFDNTDYWNEWYRDNGYVISFGKCGPYAGECPNSGAPYELTKLLLVNMPVTACANGCSYFTDVEEVTVSRWHTFDDFIYDENSPCHYKTYYRNEDPHEPWASNPSCCICPDDMNYYLSKGPELIYHYAPDGKCYIRAEYQSDYVVGIDKADNHFHELIIDYGTLHCTGPEE